MMIVLTGLAGLLSGLYAGRRRAGGESWKQIAVDFALDVWKVLCWIWNAVSGLFRKGKSSEHTIKAAD